MAESIQGDGQERDWRRQIEELQEDGRRAFLAADVAWLSEMFADDLIVHSPIHLIHDKKTVLDLLGRGLIRHTSAVEHVEAIERRGDLVVVMGWDTVTGPPTGATVHRRFTNVWRAHGSSWQLAVRQATPFEGPA
jgi:ketosteroid isomerase-like protein